MKTAKASTTIILAFIIPIAILIPTTIFLRPIQPSPPTPQPRSKLAELIPSPSQPSTLKLASTPPSYSLPASTWVPQTFNNCAPATVSMILQHFDIQLDQQVIRNSLRTNSDDKNVFTQEISDYLRSVHNIESKLLYNGNLDTIKSLIANNIYVIVEDWLRPNDDVGHVLILRGYDDNKQILISDDSYFGSNTTYSYETFDQQLWKPFNREYLPVYTPNQEALVKQIIGPDWDTTYMFTNSVKHHQLQTDQNPNDMYAWFNLGTSHFALENFDLARQAFETSRKLGWPPRMLWYQYQPILTYNQLGQHNKALELIQQGLKGYQAFPELHYQAALAHIGLNQHAQAKQSLNSALIANPNYQQAKALLNSL